MSKLRQFLCAHKVKSGSPITGNRYGVNNGVVVVAQLVCQRCEKVFHEAMPPFYGRYDEQRPVKPSKGKPNKAIPLKDLEE